MSVCCRALIALSTLIAFTLCARAGEPFRLPEDDGYRGIWYANQKSNDEYVYKYSGGMATYPQQHAPIAIYAPAANKTFFVYGGLYVMLSYLSITLQGALGYTALAAGVLVLPIGLSLITLSTRFGTIAGRTGARRFLTLGPALMTAGLLWFTRLPADSPSWPASPEQPSTLIPPASFFIDVLPAVVLFGLGIACVVAPLTNTLMGSIPERFSGLGSAINNAIARVGQPLLGALIFVAVSGTFYAALSILAPDLDLTSASVRAGFPPLNPPRIEATPDQVEAAARASIDAFHQAMTVAAGLVAIGGAVSWFGLREARPERRSTEAVPT